MQVNEGTFQDLNVLCTEMKHFFHGPLKVPLLEWLNEPVVSYKRNGNSLLRQKEEQGRFL